ncbi:MAG: SET domain-containing protein-lysine N-methyltransferase, partial [Acidobacteriota bacterium]
DEVRQYCWRLVEHVYIRGVSGGEPTPADYLNHAFEPNLVWHLGFYFAGQDIAPGDELFVDYRHLAQPEAPNPLIDTATGRPIEGLEWRRSLLAGCRELTRALEASLERESERERDA